MTGMTTRQPLRFSRATSCLLGVLAFAFWLTLAPPMQANSFNQNGLTLVQLFEWTWNDVAAECENFLGPKGYAGVQISPPTEHAVVAGYPWYQRYQPVSYRLESRSGTDEEFRQMLQRCQRAGVAVIADTILNHMTWLPPSHVQRFGSAGSEYWRYSYPGLYSHWDFNQCGRGDEIIRNYNDRWEVQNCNLENLADLKTSSSYVQATLASYINKLVDYGVRGLRIDAAKHIPAADIRAILNQVRLRDLYVLQEVIDFGAEPIHGHEYYQNGDVTEMRYSQKIAEVFRSGSLAWLKTFGEAWDLRSREKAVVFIDNHDNQRGHGAGGNPMTHKEPALYALANVFMLAHPYGSPLVMSSYAFDESSQGPPADANGRTTPVYRDGLVHCYGDWVCEHRWTAIANMVNFRKVTASVPEITDWWSNEYQQIAFGRGDKGFVVLNKEDFPLDRELQTSLPAGLYCNILSGDFEPSDHSCQGEVVQVRTDGKTFIHVNPMSAVALHVGARVRDY